jgi:hypothetical protein
VSRKLPVGGESDVGMSKLDLEGISVCEFVFVVAGGGVAED